MNVKKTESLASEVVDSPNKSSFGGVDIGAHCNKYSVFNIEFELLPNFLGSAHLQEATNYDNSNGIPTSFSQEDTVRLRFVW